MEAALAVTVQPAAPQSGGVAVGAGVTPVVSHARIPVKAFADGVAAAVYRAGRDASVKIGIRRMTLAPRAASASPSTRPRWRPRSTR